MEKIKIIISLILICFIIIILIKKSKETFYQNNTNNTNNTNNIENNSNSTNNVKNNSTNNSTNNVENDINEEKLKKMCQNVGDGLENSIKVLKLNLNDLNSLVQPAFWFNKDICFYRMEKILSLNQNLSKANINEEDYYYPLSDVLLFKNYDSYIKGELKSIDNSNSNNSNSNNSNSNNSNNSNSNNSNNSNSNNSNNSNLNNSNNTNNSNLISPSPSMDIISNKLETLVTNDNSIDIKPLTMNNMKVDDYNQPGVEGLKILVKNGRKPLAYAPNPSCVIPGTGGENLYIWEPIPPENYICLGSVCNISIRPIAPNVNNCPIRCIPISCLDEIQLSLVDDIKIRNISLPYHLFQVSNGKFIKGNLDMPNQTGINIKSHVLKQLCENTEIDNDDNPITIKLHYKNTDITGNSNPQNMLDADHFNSVKGYFEKEFEHFLVNKPELQLNDYPNNPPNPLDKPSGKRYIISSVSNKDDNVIVYLSLNKRALAYNQLKGIDIHSKLSSMVGVHKISMKIYEKNFHLFLEKVEMANLYSFDPNKIDWTKTFVDPELINENKKLNKMVRGGKEYEKDPFKFNKEMDGFLKITDSMNNLQLPNYNSPSN